MGQLDQNSQEFFEGQGKIETGQEQEPRVDEMDGIDQTVMRTAAEILGVVNEDGDQSTEQKNLMWAIEMVSKYYTVNLDKLYFTKFAGDVVGRSVGDKNFMDDVLLFHPAINLLIAIYHELTHEAGIDHEGLAMILGETRFGKGEVELTEEYQGYVDNARKFAQDFDRTKTLDENIVHVAELYKNRRFSVIHDTWVNNPDNDPEFFKVVFPYLEYKRSSKG